MKLIKNVNEDIIFETEKIELLKGRHYHHHHHDQVICVSYALLILCYDEIVILT